MSNKRGILAIVCTILLVLAGAAMPGAVSAFQDHRLESQTGSRQTLDVNLTLRKTDNMGGTLTLFSSRYTSYELVKDRQDQTEEQAEAAALEAVELLRQEGLLSGDVLQVVEGKSDVSFYVSKENDSLFSVIWCCLLETPEGYHTIYIDDTTGKLVGVAGLPTNALELGLDIADPEWMSAEAKRWADFCQSYYGFDSVVVQEQAFIETSVQFTLAATVYADNEYVQCEIPMYISGGYVYFNFSLVDPSSFKEVFVDSSTVAEAIS